ncbi:MAG: radical SAM family heme chaperone HemW [Candidatus Krumholzibacteriota bacterium]|nr:radical SAM family heme chaperone HemW [Candidatus Krumholzibacteriota bacterium]
MTNDPPPPERAPGLYVHVPFCRTKCPYCDFASSTDRSLAARFVAAAATEAARWRGRFACFNTLYVGGGTPSFLGADELAALLDGVRGALPLGEKAEVTVEANPDDVTPRLAGRLRSIGVDRVSLGVQSFDDGELAFLGRRHDAVRASAAIACLREAGPPSLALDLIFGFPGHDEARWRHTLDEALAAAPEHLSCYALTVHERTPLGRRQAAGECVSASDERQRALFFLADRLLAGRGYVHYEVSNYARGDEHRSRHNTRYWDRTPYLGLGPAAHSLLGRRRWWNPRGIGPWLAAVEAGRDPAAGEETLDDDELLVEELMLGLRTSDGVPLDRLAVRADWKQTLAELVDAGLLERRGDRVAPTPAGMLVADALPLRFLPPVSPAGGGAPDTGGS